MTLKRTVSRLQRLCAMVVGVVFLLAGIFKLFDPVGAGLVMEEYLRFLHLPFLMGWAKGIAFAMAFLESLLGAALISGIVRKLSAVLTFILLGVFTLLTLVLAIVNPEMDCGCFGEVIHLTHFQTFLKNIVLLALSFAAFLPFRNLGQCKRRKMVAFAIAAVSLAVFGFNSWKSIPSVDFTAFAPGSELLASAGGADDEEEYSSTFIYEKDGREESFTLDALPDSTWNFVRTETVRLNGAEDGDETPSLSFHDSEGLDCDQLATKGDVLVVSSYDPQMVKGEEWTRMAGTLDDAASVGFVPVLLVSSSQNAIDTSTVMLPDVRERLSGHTFFADRKTLLSLNRSNGGATWFSDGQLILKFDLAGLPDKDELLTMTGDDPAEVMMRRSTEGHLHFEGFILYILALLLLI